MAVGTPNHALRDLLLYPLPSIAASNKDTYLPCFIAVSMVEVQNAYIALAAVHARMVP
jgi:hypothetical protein